ncbi:related to enoyl-CoA hydratase/isomerase [Phialocephala subalpina]|uniref:Related to enoyl-CoA hydratase/isomerase n=1 Tax=Phialocephala subalpina TaxID=576137 RepID=A0A1L7XZ55_9HELO|nr:related to enoyl-CoA hydratase/isomerase [Phialocephala subalpina]
MAVAGFIAMCKSQWGPIPYPEKSFKDQIVIVTGANIGLGLEGARHFARLGAAKVILACRSLPKGEAAALDIETSLNLKNVVEVWQVDLSSWSSVQEFTKKAEGLERLDVVCENAAIAREYYTTLEGWESGVATNVIGTFLMALNLLPILRKSGKKTGVVPRLVVVSSGMHAWTPLEERKEDSIFEALNKDDPAYMKDRYSTTKLLEILFVRSLARELDAGPHKDEKVIVSTLDPGLCHSGLAREISGWMGWCMYFFKLLFARTTEVGGRTLVISAVKGEEAQGEYVSDGRVAETSEFVRSEEGKRTQGRVYGELMGILEGIQPGIGKNV